MHPPYYARNPSPTTGFAGLSDDLATGISKALTGGPKGSAERADQSDFMGDVIAKAGQKFVVTPEGAATVRQATWGAAIPAALLGLAVGFWLGRRKG